MAASASYILDNTGPVVTGAIAPAANAAGWNKSDVTITWSATDAGSGVASGPTPATDSQTTDTAGDTKSATATDRLGNVGNGSVAVKLDKTAPTITGIRNPAANANGWNNSDVTVGFTCSDDTSGIKSCTGATTLSTETTSTGQTVNGTAVDNADNTATTSVGPIKIDKTAPTLTGAPTTSPNATGWYKGNVTIQWTASDALSGLAGSAPANSTISSEGPAQTASASVSDRAGNTTSASSPAVNIDKTPPITTATAPSGWNNHAVTVALSPDDGLSGIAATHFTLDGNAQDGTSVSISGNGDHTLVFWSVDKAGNTETAHTVHVLIDQTPPTINHTQSPAANANGWNNGNVTVTFVCADALSGIASCTPAQTVTTEGQNQAVTGTAVDNAGNSVTDPATVSIDKTAPIVNGAAATSPNSNGWYNSDVTVQFNSSDALSGIAQDANNVTLTTEGTNQQATSTATDAAGNSASKTVSGINIDKTAPSLSGDATTAPNGNGWYSGDVTVHWTASDALSGLDGAAPVDSTITGEGNNLSASASVSDLAGNSTNATVSGIKIDRTAPSTLASVPAPLDSGWYAGDVLVTLTTGADLSGVDKTYYSVDGGAAQEYTTPFNHGLRGAHTITFWSVDKAGNVEDKTAPGHIITVKIDGVPPTINGSVSPAANGFGWNNSPVTVSFACADAESGIAGCNDAVTLSNEGAGQSATGQAQDNAGNTNSATVSNINIDTTAPTLTGAATTADNAFGWYNGNVTIHWTGQDGLSGIDPATEPGDSVISGEGSNLGAGPVTISDKAGNVSNPASVSGIKIDRTPPTISGAPTTSPNAAGWYNHEVTVGFNCADPNLADGTAGSGVATCPSDQLISTDGANQSVTSGLASDNAGNSTTSGRTVSSINIDGKAPQSTSAIDCTAQNGWCRGSQATVTITANDQVGLSGVKEIHYTQGSNPHETVVPSTIANVSITLNGQGRSTVRYWAVDYAGNIEQANTEEVRYDNLAPTLIHTLSPAANADGWNNSSVTVHFSATDGDGSGVDPTTVTQDQTISTETAGTVVNGSAADLAGNVGTDSVTIKLDKTAPTITGAATTNPNASGWYKGSVTIHFTCSDGLSGIAICPDDVVLTAEGTGQSVTRTATDKAGNSASATVSGINIDSTGPTISSVNVANGGSYTLGAVPAPTCSATDGGSGVASCTVAVTGGLANGVGTFSFTATATDKAGNTTTQTGSYNVIYRWDGFLQPINDTAHQTGLTTSIFKGGSTVPAKFQLKKADGTVVQASSLPVWTNPQKGSATTAAVDESVYSDTATSGGNYRWDSTAQQYIYNWSTRGSTSGYYYRVGVTLDDGQTYFVNIGLR